MSVLFLFLSVVELCSDVLRSKQKFIWRLCVRYNLIFYGLKTWEPDRRRRLMSSTRRC